MVNELPPSAKRALADGFFKVTLADLAEKTAGQACQGGAMIALGATLVWRVTLALALTGAAACPSLRPPEAVTVLRSLQCPPPVVQGAFVGDAPSPAILRRHITAFEAKAGKRLGV